MDQAIFLARQASWKKIIARCEERESGTIKGWCQANGISVGQYFRWKKRIREIALGKASMNQGSSIEEAGSVFVDITSRIEGLSERMTTASYMEFTTAIVIGDCRVEIKGDIDEENLKKVIRAMRYA